MKFISNKKLAKGVYIIIPSFIALITFFGNDINHLTFKFFMENLLNKMMFKFQIGEKTNRGIVKSRFYKEWKNRNNGDCSGYFYFMENGKSFNEILISHAI